MKKRKEYKAMARKNLMGNYSKSVGVYAILCAIATCYVLLIVIGILLFRVIYLDARILGTIYMSVIYLLYVLVVQVIHAGMIKFFMNICDGKQSRVTDVFYAFKHRTWRYLAYCILFITMMVVLSAIIVLPILFFTGNLSVSAILTSIFPKIVIYLVLVVMAIVLSLLYALTVFIMIDYEDMGVIASMRTSRQMLTGYRIKLIMLMASFIGMFILGYISIVGYVWVVPYMTTTQIHWYRDLSNNYFASLATQK